MATLEIERKVGIEHLNLMQKRLEVLIGGKIIERGKMEEAGRSVEQLKRKVRGFDTGETIRKWRERNGNS